MENEQVQGRRLGRKPALKGKPKLHLSRILTGMIPAHPEHGSYLDAVTDWTMGGNDTYGTCGPTSVANYRKVVSKVLGGREQSPTLDDIFDLYRRSGNPNFPQDDNGVYMQEMLEQVVKGGIGGVKALAFASVNVHSPQEVEAAISIFGGLLYGLNLDISQQSQTVWDYSPSAPWGGHAVYTGAWNEEKCVTWAQVVQMTQAFENNQMDEAWVVIWPEHLGDKTFQQGVDLPALASAYEELTGRPFPDHPAPAPPAPSGVDQALARALGRMMRRKDCPDYLRDAGTAWLAGE